MPRIRLMTVAQQRGPVGNLASFDRPIKSKTDDSVPVMGNLVACPGCGGGVKLTRANYTDSYFGIKQNQTLIYAAHRPGGKPVGRHVRCMSSQTKAETL